MAIGERIHFFRLLRGMTQKYLGTIVGFPERSADVRLAQYETGTRKPKAELTAALAQALDVSPHALDVPDIDSYVGLMHTLFTLEDLYGLSALAVSGKILLPVQKTAKQQRILQKDSSQCRQLLEAARQGDQSAMEDLAVRDMQLYSQVSQRVAKQDLYSVVETFFMPCGAECDQYTIMGYITAFRKTVNRVSGEGLYILELECNELPLRVCIGESGLLGEPKVGRRFKGDIWLQGKGII